MLVRKIKAGAKWEKNKEKGKNGTLDRIIQPLLLLDRDTVVSVGPRLQHSVGLASHTSAGAFPPRARAPGRPTSPSAFEFRFRNGPSDISVTGFSLNPGRPARDHASSGSPPPGWASLSVFRVWQPSWATPGRRRVTGCQATSLPRVEEADIGPRNEPPSRSSLDRRVESLPTHGRSSRCAV